MRNQEELKRLAIDIEGGLIFTDRHMREGDRSTMLKLVFMALSLMDKEHMEEFIAQGPALLYEYEDKAGPRSINDYPIFFSFQWLSEEELVVVEEYIRKVRSALEAV